MELAPCWDISHSEVILKPLLAGRCHLNGGSQVQLPTSLRFQHGDALKVLESFKFLCMATRLVTRISLLV